MLVLPWQQGKCFSVVLQEDSTGVGNNRLVFDPLQVHFDTPPVFVSLPYSFMGVGRRQWGECVRREGVRGEEVKDERL